MAQNFIQFRFYSDGAGKNYPNGLTASELSSGTCFSDYAITSLGISGTPGLRFNINGGGDIYLNHNGIFKLELENGETITNLKFNSSSLNAIEQNNIPLIIDMIYTNM